MNNLQTYLNQDNIQNRLLPKFNDMKQYHRFKSNLLNIVNTNQKLKEINPNSIINSALQATLLDLPLDPNFGNAYIVPYYNNKTKIFEAQLQLGWKGYVQLALRSGQYKSINATDVRMGEIITHDRLKGVVFNWINTPDRDKLPIVGYVAEFTLLNGFSKQFYMSKKEVEDHFLKYSAVYRNSQKFTIADFDTMALKTVLKLLIKRYGVVSTDLQQAIKVDSAVLNDELTPDYVDNPTNNYVVGEVVKEEYIGD